jgi:5-methylcytosine-specific restriction enzyme A
VKITNQMSVRAYECARDVYRGTVDKRLATEQLSAETGMNPESAAGYIDNLLHMLNGEVYHRTLNFFATNYFLGIIRSDFGEKGLRSALSAVRQHLNYYDALGHGRQLKIRKLLQEHLDSIQPDQSHPDEVDWEEAILEGAKKQVFVNAFERNLKARSKCVAKYGYKCSVCEFDFEKMYGEIGREFIHVHHLVEIATIGKEYKIDPIQDLRPVCPNCHAMLHQKKPAYRIEELREMLANR